MGLFGSVFSKDRAAAGSGTQWKILTSIQDLDSALAESSKRKVLIFKHSTRCFISKTVLKNFESQMEKTDKDFAYYFLDLLAYREVSAEIENQFGVMHQSPQLIVLYDGKAFANASHSSIDLGIAGN